MKMIQIVRIGCGLLLVAGFLQVGSSTYPSPDNGSLGNGIISAQQGRESGGIHAGFNGYEQDYRVLNNGSSGSGNFTQGAPTGGNLASINSTGAGSSGGNFSPGVRAAGWMS